MRHYFRFTGTADRFEWWIVSIFADLALQLALIATVLLLPKNDATVWIFIVALAVVQVTGIWLALAVTARRLRDRERSPWLMLAVLVPVVGWIWLLVECGFLPSPHLRRRRLVTRMVTAAPDSSE